MNLAQVLDIKFIAKPETIRNLPYIYRIEKQFLLLLFFLFNVCADATEDNNNFNVTTQNVKKKIHGDTLILHTPHFNGLILYSLRVNSIKIMALKKFLTFNKNIEAIKLKKKI